jgi:3'(2'), 5'-bisphosphate nucleotidase
MPPKLADVLVIAKRAGLAILPFWKDENQQTLTTAKKNGTPLSTADLAAHDILVAELSRLTPHLPILSEESEIPDFNIRQSWSEYWLLDPLDGTRSFLAGSKEWGVNIALIRQHQAVLGVIYAPALEVFYYAVKNEGAYRKYGNQEPQKISTKTLNGRMPRFVVGHFLHNQKVMSFVEQFEQAELMRLNSSLKFACIAAGEADIYPSYGPINEWDTAAGQCILEEAGGELVDFNGRKLAYNTKPSLDNPAFIALGDPRQREKVLKKLI